MQHLNLTLSKAATTGEPQELFIGILRPDQRVSIIADENPSTPNGAAAVEIDRSEAIRVIDHLREVFGIGRQELRNI